jgi:NAD(P)H-flavin reductase/hemoglobin-like flavoprotein
LIKESFSLIEPQAEDVTAYFYGRLFAENPRLRALFPPSMETPRHQLFRALTEIVWSIDSPDNLATFLARLGRSHRKFGVCREHYDALGNALLATVRRFTGTAWTAEMGAAWSDAYATAARMMIAAADEDAAELPPWWVGEVVEHELRGTDLGLLTVRPGQRLPYRAGQYVTIQTARWPRVWRPYSIANAPGEDGLLRFHVRAVPAGWVSGALVRHTRVGDSLLLGPATGSMTLDPDSDRDLLCVAGGTGLSPLKALIEEAIRGHAGRKIHLLVGARTRTGLYDGPALEALKASCPALEVIPVVSDDPEFDGMRGKVSDVLDRFPSWAGHDVYVAGPAPMVERTISKLEDLGVPPIRIRHDRLDQ